MLARVARAARDGFGLIAPRGATEIADEQTRGLRITAIALSACGLNGLAMVMVDFGAQAGPRGTVIATAVAALYATWIGMAVMAGRRPWFMRASVALLVAQGAAWGALLYRLAEVATDRQSNFVVAIAMALVSTPMLGAPFAIAVAFWLPVAIGTEAALAWGLRPADPDLALCFLGYEMFTVVGIVYLNRTLLDRSKARFALATRTATVSLLLKEYEENAADWLWETDADGLLRGITRRFAEVLGTTDDKSERRSLRDVLNTGTCPIGGSVGDRGEVMAALAARRAFRDAHLPVRVNGEDKWWCLSGKPIETPDGRFAGYRGVGSDVTEARRAAESTAYLAAHDPLTGVANRRVFQSRLEDFCAAARRDGRPCALLLLDLDRFKEINDVHGHGCGDEVLTVVAGRLRRGIRPGDVLARLGGDEFAVLLIGTGRAEAGARAAALGAAIGGHIDIGGTPVAIGASIGIAIAPEDGGTAEEMMRNADLALYSVKGNGRGAHRVFDRGLAVAFDDRTALLADLRRAIEEDTLSVDYQPIVDVSTGRIVSMEALCRWLHPTRGAVPPSTFIPLAEECGLVGRLGRQVLAKACRAGRSAPDGTTVSVNLSPLQLRDPEFAGDVRDVLAETGFNPGCLEIEITESFWLDDNETTRAQLDNLARLGAKVVMDDFGTGFSSLSSLRRFRFEGIKLDAEFTRAAEGDRKAAAIVRMVVALASVLGITLTAEGIETERQMDFVRSHGIARAQGYLLGRPGPWTAARAREAALLH